MSPAMAQAAPAAPRWSWRTQDWGLEDLLFSAKCFAAAMLAYYVALKIGLQRPYWAVTTSYIVAQPLSGAVLSKAVFRVGGTVLGATGAVVLVPTFVNEPLVLSLALALWLGMCLYFSLLDRTPRAYVFLLAGYTASIIGFPSVTAPDAVFNTAILRVQEILIGILAGSFVHGAIWPRTVTSRLHVRVDQMLAEAEHWTRHALAEDTATLHERERRRLALDIGELDQLSVHLPFDTARLVPRVRTVRALQDELTMILPLATTAQDRLAALEACPEGVPPEVRALVDRVSTWLKHGIAGPDREAEAATLIAETIALEPAPHTESYSWHEMLLLNLLARLRDLIVAHRDCRALRDQMRAPGVGAISPHVHMLLARAGGRGLHRDRGLALRSCFGTIAAIMIGCALWIATAWPDGAGAVLIAGVCCALFGNADNPGPLIFQFLIGSALGILIAAPYAFVIMPRVTDFVTLAAVLAPALLLIGFILAHPKHMLLVLGLLIGLLNTVGLNATYEGDFATFTNGAIAQLLGTGFAVITVGLFQTVGVETSIGRLLRAAARDIARRARGRARDDMRWTSRMLDRVGLLTPRLAARGPDPQPIFLDLLIGLRIGVNAGQVAKLRGNATPEEARLIDRALAGIARHFEQLDPRQIASPPVAVLEDIDHTIAAFAADANEERRRQGLVLLTSLRRNLFPDAAGYDGGPAVAVTA
jgi:uncharacterized membrane protein YccC